MARDVESLVLMMSADLRRFQRSMDQANALAQKRLTAIESQALKSQKNLERIMARAGQGMVNSLSSSLKGLAPTLAAAFSTQQVIQYADAYTGLQNRLKAAGLEGEALKRVEDGLYAAANRNGVAVEATAQLYQRAAMARQNLGASEQQLMQIVSGTSAALKLQGTSAGEASGALLQLGQLLGGNMVQSQEYSSLIDGLPTVLEAVAKGSDRWGGSINKLTQDVKAGKVTSQEFFQAALKGFADIEARAAGSTTTVGAALQTLNNQLGRFVGQTDSSLSATARMAQGIEWLANNLDDIVPIIGALVGLVGVKYVWALTAATGAQVANGVSAARLIAFQTAMTASMTGTTRASLIAAGATRTFNAALVANPIGAVLVAVTALAAGIAFLSARTREASEAQKELDRRTGELDEANRLLEDAINKVSTAQGEARQTAIEEANALVVLTRKKIEDAKASLDAAEAELTLARARAQSYAEAQRQTGAVSARGDIGESGAFGGAGYVQSGFDQAVSRSEAAFEKGKSEIARLREKQAKLVEQLENPDALGGGLDPDAASARGRSGPSPADLAAQREMLDLEARLALARAQGREEVASQLADQIDTIRLTKTYEDAGFANAKAKAQAQVASLRAAENSAEYIAQFERDQNQFIADATRQREQQAALAEDELGLRVEIARLLGDEAGAQAALRELDIVRRIADLRAKGLSEPEAERQATRETDQLRGAEIVGGLGSAFQDPLEQMRAQYEEIDRLRQDDVLSEQEAAAAKAQANALYQEQRLSSASSFFGTLASLQDSSNKELAAIGKAAAIAQATMDGYVAVQKALASAPPPFNYALAAAVGVVAAANVAKIAGMADGGPVQGVGGPRQDNQLRYLSVGEYVVNAKAAKQNRALLDAMNYGGGIARMADGGIVGVPNFPNVSALSRPSSSSFSYSPTIDARGADLAAVARLERLMAEERRRLPEVVMGVVGRKAKYRLGKNAEA